MRNLQQYRKRKLSMAIPVIHQNDFINCMLHLFLYDRVDFDRTYWSDYEVLYHDAKEYVAQAWDTLYTFQTNEPSVIYYNPGS
jgi:hypothetical protein